jgi:hypothetical protein
MTPSLGPLLHLSEQRALTGHQILPVIRVLSGAMVKWMTVPPLNSTVGDKYNACNRQHPGIRHSLLLLRRLPNAERQGWNVAESQVGFCDRRGSDECTIRSQSARQRLMQRA